MTKSTTGTLESVDPEDGELPPDVEAGEFVDVLADVFAGVSDDGSLLPHAAISISISMSRAKSRARILLFIVFPPNFINITI